MSTEPLPTIAQRIADDIEAFDFDAAFAKLADPQGGGALGPVLSGLLRARVQVGLEQRRDAYDTLQQVRGLRELGVPERLEAQLATARVLRLGWWSTDVALDMALAAAEQATRTGRRTLAVEAHLEAAQLFARKRCRDLSQRQIDAAQQLQVDAALVHATRGELAISFDQRPTAKEAFEAALALAEGDGEVAARQGAARLGRLGLARLFTVLGEFDAAREQLLALGDRPPGDLAAHRVTWRLHAAQADWARSAQVLARMLAASPASDPARSLMLEHASALYRAGDLDGAQAAWTKIAASGGGDWAARTAAGLLDKLQAGNTRRTRLQAFPSVTQLRDHCGPASVELCMRFFGTTAEQVAVAREIKHPDGGTPVHKMRRYMDAAGFHTRRIEADLPRLQVILDAGIPVIIEEDYSTTRHVAVAIGYDDRRGILEVQDPMTHEVRETPYAELGKLREFSNHGALVAVPAARTDLIEALDRAGALECAYISTTDRAWAAHDDGLDADADRLVDEAIALHEPYELAWVLRFVRARDRYDRERSQAHENALAEVLGAILRLWPDDEWPQQFLGRVRDVQGRTGEALAAFERARDRDPDDPSNWCAIGDCKLALGDRAGAREAFEQALRRDPAHTRSNENLADMAFDAGDNSLAAVLNDCARELAPRNAFNWHVYARILARRDALDDAIASYARAIELRPESTGFAVEHARLLARRGRVDEAIANLETLREQRPDDTFVLMSLADLAFMHGRHDTSLAACARFAEVDPKSATPLAIGGAAKCAKGELEAGLADLRAALSRRPTYAWAHREIGRALLDAQRFDEAIAACAAGLGFATGSGESMFRLGDALVRAGHGPDGAGYLRRAARSGALEQAQLDRVAAALHEVEGINPAHEFFNTLGHEQPREVAVARAHAGLLLERIWAPGAANAVLSRLSELAPRDAWVVADGANALMGASLADERRGEVLFAEAIAAAPDRVAPRRWFARRLNARGRFAEALAVLEPCAATPETMADRVHALLGLRRDDEAVAAIDTWCEGLPPELRAPRRRPLDYRIAHVNGRWEHALALATALASDAGELDDDGRLGRWEESRFECLVELDRLDEAESFGLAQAGTAEELGVLAYTALAAGKRELAARLAERCHAKDPNDAYGLTVLARLADCAGDVERATALWQRMKGVSRWHIHNENLGRLALAGGDRVAARELVAAAVAGGHTCPEALHLRAQLRVQDGDREGALADIERARACVQLERRDAVPELDGLLAALRGDLDAARRCYVVWLDRGRPSDSDRAIQRAVAAALGL